MPKRVPRQAAVFFEALAPHAVFFDEHRPRAENGCRGGGRKTSGAGADDANVRSELVRHQPAELTGLEVNFGVKSSWLYCRRGANAADPIMDIPYISLAGQMTLGKSGRGAWRTLARLAVALTSHEGSRISRANRAARAMN